MLAMVVCISKKHRAPPPRIDPQPERCSSSPLLASRALATPLFSPARAPAERQLAVAVENAGVSSFLSPTYSYHELLWFKPFPFLSLSTTAHTQSTKHRRRHLLQLRRPPARRGQPIPVHPAPLQPPGKLDLTSLTLPSHSPWPDFHRNYPAAVIVSPVSSCHRRTPPSAPFPFDSTAPIASSPPVAAFGPEHCPTTSPEPSRRRAPLRRRLGRRGNPTSSHPLPFPRPPAGAP
jgi:hypothetical protein